MASTNNVATESALIECAPGLTPASVPPCRHDVQFYFDDRFLVRSLIAFIGDALKAGSSAIVVATQGHRDSLEGELERAGVNLVAMVEQGRYVALDAAETLAQFMVNGAPDETRFRDLLGRVISCSAAAARRDHNKLVIFGEMVTLLWQRGEGQAAVALEQLWNQLSQVHSFHLLCGYPLAGFDRQVHTEMFSRICGEHEVVIPAEGYTDLSGENDRLRTIVRLQQAEQVLKTEAEERRKAQARALEVQGRNQQLAKEVRQREAAEDELRRFTRRLLTARDEEQRRIAAELHENTAQLLSALSLYFSVLNEEKASLNPRLASVVDSSRSVSDSLIREIRKLSHLLHPPTLDDMGLTSALREYVEQFNAASGTSINLEIPLQLGRFSRDLEIAVFRIVEEALSNLYPASASASVRLTRSDDALMIEIQKRQSADSGLESAAGAETRIMGIHARVMEHGGTVQFTSDPSGSLISVKLPLSDSTARDTNSSSPLPVNL
ncbi:MAG TPA: MEDS domain-containing protein [Candidatus Sulfotelmatobacter sp.]|nr:MEDS domain-containing protein [Candidatus Sulfotelmatobacter sp.]